MRLYTIKYDNKEQVAVEDCSENLILVKDLGYEANNMNEFVTKYSKVDLSKLQKMIDENNFSKNINRIKLEDTKICSPIPKPKQDVVCLGANYGDHIKEIETGITFEKKKDTVYFSKRVAYASGDGDVIPAYEGLVDRLDYEVELGVVLGTTAKNLTMENALDCVFGYTVINDVSARNLQNKHQQWYLGKSLDGFLPMGPCIVTADEIDDVTNLNLTCKVNGELRQNSNTKYMIQPVREALVELTQGMTLEAGTVIATGTPGGVGMGMNPPCFLKKGDKVTCEIEKIGKIENIVG